MGRAALVILWVIWDENAQTLTFNAALPASPVCHFSGVLVPNKLVDFSDAMDAGH